MKRPVGFEIRQLSPNRKLKAQNIIIVLTKSKSSKHVLSSFTIVLGFNAFFKLATMYKVWGYPVTCQQGY